VVDGGNVTKLVATGIDVTEQRQLESRLAHADRLDSIGRLTAGIVHDFNNTLTTLGLRIDRLLGRDLDRESRVDVDAIAGTLSRTQNLVGRLLSFSSEQELQPVTVDINTEIERTSEAHADLLGCDIGVHLELSREDAKVLVDVTRFEQTLTNLTINARDAMPDGGLLTITTTIESIEPRAVPNLRTPGRLSPGHYVVISVSDTGVGIDPDHLRHVFDPYFTTKPPGEGTGLGLATAYGFLAQSGGAIGVISEPGLGTTFDIWLPRS
jgi:signal transduction histidine kinase